MPISGKCRRNLASHLHTKIVEDCAAPLSNTLHIPDGTVVERGMFRLRNWYGFSKAHTGTTANRFGDCASRRIRRSHTPRDLGTALTLDDSNVVLALQIKPKLGTISKISAEPDGRICGYRPTSIQYVCDATRWYAEI